MFCMEQGDKQYNIWLTYTYVKKNSQWHFLNENVYNFMLLKTTLAIQDCKVETDA